MSTRHKLASVRMRIVGGLIAVAVGGFLVMGMPAHTAHAQQADAELIS